LIVKSGGAYFILNDIKIKWAEKLQKLPNLFFIFCHLIFSSFYLYTIAHRLANYFFEWYSHHIYVDYLEWARLIYTFNKPYEIAFYWIYSILIGSYIISTFLAYVFLCKIYTNLVISLNAQVNNKVKKCFFLLAVSFLINSFISFNIDLQNAIRNFMPPVIIWILFFVIISFLILPVTVDYRHLSAKLQKPLCYLLFILITASSIYNYWPLVTGHPFIYNEFTEISGSTIIDNKIYEDHTFFKKYLYYPRFKKIEDIFDKDIDSACYLKELLLKKVGKKNDENFYKMKNNELIQWHNNVGKDPLNRKFIDANEFSFFQGILYRTFDQHHNQILNPVNAWMLGVPYEKTLALYGYLTAWITKIWFNLVGEFSYTKWFQFIYSIDVIYFLLLLLSAWYFFRSFSYAVAIYALAVVLLIYQYYMGYYYIIISRPITGPFRHFFDVLIFLLIALSFKYKSIIVRCVIAFLCFLSVLLSDHLGLCLCVATFFVYMVRFFEKGNLNKNNDLLTAILICLAAITAIFLSPSMKNPALFNFFNGIFTHSFPESKMILILTFYSVFFFIVLYHLLIQKMSNTTYAVLWSSTYSYLLLSHYFWHGYWPDAHAALPILAIFIVASIILLFIDNLKFNKEVVTTFLLFMILMYGLAWYVNFYKTKNDYLNIAKTHITGTWKNKRAQLYTSIPEEPFKNAIDLLNKYSDSESRIYLVSKYDFFLPVLANKYNDLIYPNLSYWILTIEDRNKVINQIRNKQPNILFVDTDIDLKGQLWTVNNYFTLNLDDKSFFYENKRRLLMLYQLKYIFDQIRSNYGLVEEGKLISVYKKLRE